MERSTVAASLDDERAEMQRHVADAEARVRELEAQLAHKANELGSALEDARSRAEDAERRVATTMARAEDAERRATEMSFAVQAAEARARTAEDELAQAKKNRGRTGESDVGAPNDRVAELERTVGQLEQDLEQMQVRARRAYAEAEAANAQLASVQDGDGAAAAVTGGEVARLRAELAHAIERANAAEERLSRAQADLRAGDAADDRPEPVTAPAGGEGASFRHRLTRAADRKKGRDPDSWSG
jgi:chromosome segregation ATPase